MVTGIPDTMVSRCEYICDIDLDTAPIRKCFSVPSTKPLAPLAAMIDMLLERRNHVDLLKSLTPISESY